jgi:hypothetical protein
MTRLPFILATILALGGCRYSEQVHVVAAPAVGAVDTGSVSVQLASFRQADQEPDQWYRITRDYPEVGLYQPRLVAVPDLPYTRIYELYIDSVPGKQAASLCAEMLTHGSYCAIQATTVAPMSPDLAAPIMMPPAAAPPPGDRPQP